MSDCFTYEPEWCFKEELFTENGWCWVDGAKTGDDWGFCDSSCELAEVRFKKNCNNIILIEIMPEYGNIYFFYVS